jgi:DNA repair exonuclease SbcCD ATPase subunit
MKPFRLYIEDFMCYDNAYVDFTEFSSALIVGKKEHNDDVSNGVGKTSMFKAIEYALFGHSDSNLENIIRDDAESCNVTVDFEVANQEYRVTRTRTRKGATDLTLYKRTGTDGTETEVLHTIRGDKYEPVSDEKYWADISGRRSADTEKELAKLIKVNIKSFRIFVHFMQHDFSGLTTATPEKRKAILRDALSLIVYSKLEKMAKDKAGTLSKELDKLTILTEGLGDPDSLMVDLSTNLLSTESELSDRQLKLANLETLQTQINEKVNKLVTEHAGLENKFSALLVQEQTLNNEKTRLETSIKEYHTKKSNVVKAARDTVSEIRDLEETQLKLIEIDFNQSDVLSEQIITNKEKVAQLSLTMQNDMARIEKLKKPIPKDGECEECRQPITAEHRKICQTKLNEEREERQLNILNCKKEIASLNSSNAVHQQTISQLTLSKQHLESINTKIATKKKELVDKRTFHDEFQVLLDRYEQELKDKNKIIEEVAEALKNSSIDEAKALQKQIQVERQNITLATNQISALNKEIAHFNAAKAVMQHDMGQKTEDKRKKIQYQVLMKELDTKLAVYPSVIQAFSSTGIPNLIIQNVLDDLQVESNNLLNQLKPGIQLSFFIEKTKGDGTEADTLDINYMVNGKKRYYENLSGAMQLAVTFSLKLGLSFLLQKMAGVDIKFLLLDEIDQSLDKASVDAFADIVKFFQKDFTILVITHNDRLKDKFSHAILVEQDINMISRARVVSSW